MTERTAEGRLARKSGTSVRVSERGAVTATPRPLKAIRAHCLRCCSQSPHEVRECPVMICSLHEYRAGHRPPAPGRLTPLRAICRPRCLDCSNTAQQVRRCDFDGTREELCPLYPYRTGHRPQANERT